VNSITSGPSSGIDHLPNESPDTSPGSTQARSDLATTARPSGVGSNASGGIAASFASVSGEGG
jgi:hypothetical protein